MNSQISLHYNISLESCTFENITALFKSLLPLILEDVFTFIFIYHIDTFNLCIKDSLKAGDRKVTKW